MRHVLRVVSWLALAATLAAPVAYLAGAVDHAELRQALLAATVAWFARAPLALRSDDRSAR